MIQSILLTAALLISPAAFAQGDGDNAAPNGQEAPGAINPEAAKPAPEFVHLDQSLTRALDDKTNGRLDEPRYQEFLTKFRADLAEALSRVKPTPLNTALHARILSRLGDSKQALAALDPAIKQDPNSPDLRAAASQVHFDQKDYPAALAEANAALEIDPSNKEAQALKHFSEGRTAAAPDDAAREPSAAGFARLDWTIPEKNDISPKALTLINQGIAARRMGDMAGTQSYIQAAMNADPTSTNVQKIYGIMQADQIRHAETKAYIQNAAGAMNAGRGDEAVSWAQKAYERTPNEDTLAVLEKVRHDSAELAARREAKSAEELAPERTPPVKNGGIPLWPLLPAMAIGGTAYVVAKSRKTVESEDGYNENDRPQPGEGQRFVAGAVLAGMAGAAIYLAGAYAVSAAPALLARFMTGPGQQAMRLAQSEAGAINPSGILRIGPTNLTLSQHAVEQISRRGLSLPQIESALVGAQEFQYFHEGAWKIGYYDPVSKIFLAQYQGNVITVISNVKPQYIENLRGLKP